MKRTLVALLTLSLLAIVFTISNTRGQDGAPEADVNRAEQWEYLVVAGASNNLTSSNNPSLRKEPGPFTREAFVLEQNLDKLGARGWELILITGNPSDPVYFFKRRK
jgi:hypothetical protein